MLTDFRLLGPVEVVRDGIPAKVGGRRERTLLAVLLLAKARVVAVDRLIDVVWGERPPETARRQVHTGMSALRRAVGSLLETAQSGYVLRAEPENVDMHLFMARVKQARRDTERDRLAEAHAGLVSALDLWRGPALSGLPGLIGEAAGLEEQRVAAIEDRIAIDLKLGLHADVSAELAILVHGHPLRQRLQAQLMLAYYRCGRTAEALNVYHVARRVFAESLGLAPPGELRRLERAILTEDPSLDLAPMRLRGDYGTVRPMPAPPAPPRR